jgi:hypothetical protein
MDKETIITGLQKLANPNNGHNFYANIQDALQKGALATAIRAFLCDNEAVFQIGNLQNEKRQTAYLTCDGIKKAGGYGSAIWKTKQEFEKHGEQVEKSDVDEGILSIAHSHGSPHAFFKFLIQFIKSI